MRLTTYGVGRSQAWASIRDSPTTVIRPYVPVRADVNTNAIATIMIVVWRAACARGQSTCGQGSPCLSAGAPVTSLSGPLGRINGPLATLAAGAPLTRPARSRRSSITGAPAETRHKEVGFCGPKQIETTILAEALESWRANRVVTCAARAIRNSSRKIAIGIPT